MNFLRQKRKHRVIEIDWLILLFSRRLVVVLAVAGCCLFSLFYWPIAWFVEASGTGDGLFHQENSPLVVLTEVTSTKGQHLPPSPNKEVSEDPLFAQVVAIYVHKLQFSARAIHTFVCKQLLTAKCHESWFHYARRPLRFSLQEFYVITGMKYNDEPDLKIDDWEYDGGFWSKFLRRQKNISVQQIRKVHVKLCNTWSRIDRLRLVYLCVIAGILMAKDEKVWIPHKYIKLVMDFEKMRKYLWGLHSFDMLVSSIIKARDKVKTQNNYVIDGFSYALQIWLMEAVPDIGSLLGQKLREGVTTMRCRNWKGSAKISNEDIITIESNFASTGYVFPCISTSGNFKDVITDAEFAQPSEMKDERVDLIIDMQRNNSEEDGSDEEAAVETSDTKIEEEIESTRVSTAKKRKNRFRDTGAESRKKRLLCQRSTEKYRDLEEEMKSYIQSMFNSSFTALGLELREVIEDRFIKLEEKILSSQTQGSAPANTQTRGADPFWTPSVAAAATAPASVSARAPAPTPASVSTSGLAPSCSAASAPYRSRASATAHTGGPANAAKTRSQTKIEFCCWFLFLNKIVLSFSGHGRHDVLFREKTALRQWRPDRVAFLSCMFSNQIITAYGKFDGNRRGYKIDDNFLEYGRGELPYHGSTCSVWSVDVDRLYIPICVNQIHWISICVNLVNRTVDVFDCGGKKNNRVVEAFAVLIPRIVKAVQSPERKKDFNVKQYTVSYVPMRGLNMSGNDCGAYSLKFIECHLFALDFSLVNDENIKEARHKIAYDLWEAANDEVLQSRMSTYKPPKRAPVKPVDLG
uniref:Ubiquitin-like protease family profile domain-containing protein n=1 Tax=Brassica oleracea var. oleracea TaxID=109376 RepID=A0A0D3BHH7_BRAOL